MNRHLLNTHLLNTHLLNTHLLRKEPPSGPAGARTRQPGGAPARGAPLLHATARRCALVLAAGALTALAEATPAAAQRPTAERQASTEASAPDTLRPGDVVRLRIWREPDLSGDFAVDETGVVVFPKIGPINVTTESPRSLREKLVSAYAEHLNHNSIDVVLLRRIQVLGAVRQPGVYPVDATMTISDVLAVAGGTTNEGNPKKLELIRDGRRVPVQLTQRSRIGESPVRSGDQIFVPERSWFRRNSGFLVGTAITTLVSVVLTFATR